MNSEVGRRLAVAALFAVTVTARPSFGEDRPSVDLFFKNLYEQYAPGRPEPDFLAERADEIFSIGLLTLIRADQKFANGEVGILDHDPICACQDYENLGLKYVDTKKIGDGEIFANVEIENSGKKIRLEYTLVDVSGSWRIDDIGEGGIPSLKSFLAKGLEKYIKTKFGQLDQKKSKISTKS